MSECEGMNEWITFARTFTRRNLCPWEQMDKLQWIGTCSHDKCGGGAKEITDAQPGLTFKCKSRVQFYASCLSSYTLCLVLVTAGWTSSQASHFKTSQAAQRERERERERKTLSPLFILLSLFYFPLPLSAPPESGERRLTGEDDGYFHQQHQPPF